MDKEGQPARAREKKPVGRYRRDSRPGKEQATISPCSGPLQGLQLASQQTPSWASLYTGHWGREGDSAGYRAATSLLWNHHPERGVGTSMHACCIHSVVPLCNSMDRSPPGSSVHDSPGKNTGVDCCPHLQGIFPTQGSNLHLLSLLHWQADSLPLVPLGMPSSKYISNKKEDLRAMGAKWVGGVGNGGGASLKKDPKDE